MIAYQSAPLLPDVFIDNPWRSVPDGYLPACAMYLAHYSCTPYADGRRRNQFNRNRNLFVGPGEKMPLMTPHNDALFVWRKFIDASGQQGINCAVFRNQSEYLSSWLIERACAVAWQRWPGERLYTYVNPAKIRSTNPGYCFLRAGWTRLELRTKSRRLAILEVQP